MAILPLVSDYTEGQYRASGRRYFQYIWQLVAFNDVICQIEMPGSLRSQAVGCSVTITNMAVVFIGTIGAILNPIYTQMTKGNISMFFPSHTTALATDVHYLADLNWIFDVNAIPPANVLLNVFVAGSVPADSMVIQMNGYLEMLHEDSAQPVSLEGYKWPLSRR